MFADKIYIERRKKLRKKISSGVILFLGNVEAPANYPDNTYYFRQDSNFSYFFGLDLPGLAGVIDIESGEDIIFGTELTMDDIIWMGPQPKLTENAAKAGISTVRDYSTLHDYLNDAISKGRKIHFVKPYRGEQTLELSKLVGLKPCAIEHYVSVELIKAIVSLREIKSAVEIKEIEKAVDVAYEMHTAAMKMAKSGVYEYQVAGVVDGITLQHNGHNSFPSIITINGHIMHNHTHNNMLTKGRMLVVDAGAEIESLYDSDITRTTPVDGKFDSRQKDIYEAVLAANMKGIEGVKPGEINVNNHIAAVTTLLDGLKELGLVKGNTHDAVMNGVGAFFMPHGLGHQMGMDVHDMEGLGEDYVGYDEKTKRSKIPGIGSLRMGKELRPGHVFTVEPGCYFIPAWYDLWKGEKRAKDFINYDKVAKYLDFGGIRIEDNILVTKDGYRVLSTKIPKTVADVEAICRG